MFVLPQGSQIANHLPQMRIYFGHLSKKKGLQALLGRRQEIENTWLSFGHGRKILPQRAKGFDLNLLEILQEYGVDYRQYGQHHHVTKNRIGVDCPYCSKDSHRFRMGIRGDRPFATCWTCGSHPLVKCLAELTGQPAGKITSLLETDAGAAAWKTATTPQAPTLEIPKGLGPLLPAHRSYLRCRGFNPDELEKLWGLKGIGLASNLAWRIWIPIISNGETVSWTTRSLVDEGIRYVNARADQEIISPKTLLYGEDHCRHSVVVCEGPTDTWRIGPGAVATMGVGWSKTQLNRIAAYPVRAIIFDSESKAQLRARRLVEMLEPLPGETYLVSLDAPDPGSASLREVKLVRKRFLE